MSEATIQQQSPDCWQAVIEDMKARRLLGIERYGVGVFPFNGRDAALDKYEELLDACVYAKQQLEERRLESRYDLTKKVRLWDAINEYVKACGGDTSAATIGERRMNAVALVERVVEGIDRREV